MHRIAILLASSLLLASPASAQSGPPQGGNGGPPGAGGPPGGGQRAPKPMKPVKRESFDRALTAMFRESDTDGDGMITVAEFRAAIDERRNRAIRARFDRLDSNRDGSLSFDEFAGWQRQLGSAAISEDQQPIREMDMVPAVIQPTLGEDDDDKVLRLLIEPLGVTLITAANTNYDAGMSLAEFLAHQGKRFDAADSDGDGAISMDEMRQLQPTRDNRRPPSSGDRGAPRPAD